MLFPKLEHLELSSLQPSVLHLPKIVGPDTSAPATTSQLIYMNVETVEIREIHSIHPRRLQQALSGVFAKKLQ